MLGKVKIVPLNDGGLPFEPTPNYHSHVLYEVARPTDGAAEAQRRSQVCAKVTRIELQKYDIVITVYL